MSFPLIYLLYLYFAFIFGWLIFSLVAMYHLVTFGFKKFSVFLIGFLYLVGSVFIFNTTYRLINDAEVDWQTKIYIFNQTIN